MFRVTWSVTDAVKVESHLKCAMTGNKKDRMAVATTGVIELYDPEDAGSLHLALDGAGIVHTFREVEDAPVVGETTEPDPEVIDLKAERVKALAAKLAAIPYGDDAVKGWLEACEAEQDVVILVAAGAILAQAEAPTHLLAILEDRVRVLQRPGPGETRVLSEGERELDVVLSDEEVGKAGLDAANTYTDIERMENTQKEVAKLWKSRIEVARDSLKTLLQTVASRKATRKVRVLEVLDYGTNKIRTIRADTNEVLSERDARMEELQLPIPFPSKDEPPEEDEDEGGEE
jgi:hypothetical protein